jgi:telomeric repeat-binding factor 2-interacting protein 1
MEQPGTGSRGDAGNAASRLFEGKQFWLSLEVPQRRWFMELIQVILCFCTSWSFSNALQKHGGVVRLQERDADIMLVDHMSKNLPPNV